jgi:acylphosphatase
MVLCKRVHYWGAVQGVGFRMTTKRIAGQFAVTGYVCNLPDGQVEIVVAGEKGEIDGFLGEVATRMAPFIQGHRIVDASDQLSSFTGFEIRI